MSEERKPGAEAKGGLDNLFRSTLDSYQVEPSASTWKGINRKLLKAELARFNFSNLPKVFWIGAAGVVLIGLVFLFNQIPDGTTTQEENASVTLSKRPDKETVASLSVSKNNPNTKKEIPGQGNASLTAASRGTFIRNSGQGTPSPVLASTQSNLNTLNRRPAPSVDASSEMTELSMPAKATPASESTVSYSGNRTTGDVKPEYMTPLSVAGLSPVAGEDTLLRFTTLNTITNVPVTTKVQIPQFYTVNMGISPELSVYRNDDKYTETNFWLNAGFTYHAGRFSVQTGAALGYVFDHANYRVDYKSKDSIGYFTSIVSFTVTSGNTIIYSTKDIPVYDSLQHVADDRTVNRYTYLRIPLMLGYQLVETNRFSLGIKAGPAISFLIGTREAQPFIDYPNARLIRVESNTLERVKMNWDIQAALDLEYRLVKNFSIYAEPYYKHFFNPFATGESTATPPKDPYSVGIEIGARFNFGRKNSRP